MTDAHLFRFLDAQDKFHRQAVAELAGGRKRTHWMWFVFPQLTGLGHSENARHFAIQDIEQAQRYLEDPVLGSRLRDDVRLMLGPLDHLKFQSCLTLFREAAGDELHTAITGVPTRDARALVGHRLHIMNRPH